MHKVSCLFSVPQLQDLAVSPNIRDPQLNSAECVTEGHEPNIMATGHSGRIIAILCCSFLFAVFSGPLLAFYVLDLLKKYSKTVTKTVNYLCRFLILTFVALLVYKEVTICKADQSVPGYIHAVYPVIVFVGIVVGACTCGCCPGEDRKILFIPYMVCANLTAYHFCWLLVGIMLHPIWGLAALLVVCLIIGVFSYAVYTILCVCYRNPSYGKIPTESNNKTTIINIRDNNVETTGSGDNRIEHLEKVDGKNSKKDGEKHTWQAIFSCLAAFLAVCCLIVVVILAGQSYHGRQTADEVLKDAVLYLISVCFSWLYWKNIASKPSQNTAGNSAEQASSPSSQNADTGV